MIAAFNTYSISYAVGKRPKYFRTGNFRAWVRFNYCAFYSDKVWQTLHIKQAHLILLLVTFCYYGLVAFIYG